MNIVLNLSIVVVLVFLVILGVRKLMFRTKNCLEKALLNSKELSLWIHKHTNNIGFNRVTDKEKMAIALFQQSLDVEDGIIVILEQNLPGAALALARPRFESYVRGVWLLNAALDEGVEKFINGKCPKFSTLMNEIGDDAESGGAWIKANANANLNDFHDLTHGGMSHILRRCNESSIEPNYPIEELVALVNFGLEIKIRIGVELLARAEKLSALKRLNIIAGSIRNASKN